MGDDGFVPSQLEPWLDKRLGSTYITHSISGSLRSQPPETASAKKVQAEEEARNM